MQQDKPVSTKHLLAAWIAAGYDALPPSSNRKPWPRLMEIFNGLAPPEIHYSNVATFRRDAKAAHDRLLHLNVPPRKGSPTKSE